MEFVGKMQGSIRKTSTDLTLLGLKLVSGGILGLTFALIMQEILGKADGENLLAFFFMIVVTTGVFVRVTKSWGFAGVLVFDLVGVLLGLVLRLYIMVAPGA